MKTFKKSILSWLVVASVLTFLPAAFAENPPPESSGQYIDDSAITAKIKARFVDDDVIKSSQIHVTTSNGVVELSGLVDTRIQKDRAEKIAETTAGVRDVKNNIEVK